MQEFEPPKFGTGPLYGGRGDSRDAEALVVAGPVTGNGGFAAIGPGTHPSAYL